MDANPAALVGPNKHIRGDRVFSVSSEQIIEFYEEASEDYRHWSPGLNMHLGYFRWGTNPLRRERMLEQLNIEIASRLRVKLDQPTTLIDLGCGMGAVARWIARYYPSSLVNGVTLSPSQVRIAGLENLKAGLHDRIKIFEGNYTDLPITDHSVDGVWAVESACYAGGRAKEDLTREMARVLKQGGRFVIADCFVKRRAEKMNLFARKSYAAACKNWALTEMANLEDFVSALKTHGLDDLSVEDISWRTAPSLFHAPFAVSTFMLGKIMRRERLGPYSRNNLKASLQALFLGAHRSNFGYYLISGVRR